MLLILSEDDDGTTDYVIEWLKFLKKDYIRINESNPIKVNALQLNDGAIELEVTLVGGEVRRILLSDITGYWYRRGHLNIIPYEVYRKPANPIEARLFYYLSQETEAVKEYIYHYLSQRKHVGSYYENKLNKLIVLNAAQNAGLRIPQTLVSSRADVLEGFVTESPVITKGFTLNGFFNHGEYNAICSTVEVNLSDISSTEAVFLPSLFQHYVEKLFELRIFYWDETLFTTAIMSQQNEKTRIDFRNYDTVNPNRQLPYTLPTEVEEKIKVLMKGLNMKSGSLDMMVDKNGDYVFLEINPVGQFMSGSHACNFKIEQYIAQYFAHAGK
jgi:ATP-GRASP peptide maturase of grasp-with-spasm system